MKKAVSLVAIVLLLTTSLPAFADTEKSALTVPVNGTYAEGTFTGTFAVTRFEAAGDQLLAHGVLSGTLTSNAGVPLGSVMKSVAWPVDLSSYSSATRTKGISTNATCDVLTLVLGPLHLDLLGLTVDLNRVVLEIAAVTGSGNLLGNLLCSVVSLLDGAGSLVDIAQLLNRILEILGDLLG